MYESIIEGLLPNALAIGVEYDVFWDLTPITLAPFTKAFIIRKQMEDSQNWQLGVYIQMAVGSLLSEKNKYPKEPIFSNFEEALVETDEEREERQAREQMELIKERFMLHAEMLNAEIRKGVSNET